MTKQEFEEKNFNGQQLFAIVQRIIKASKPYYGCSDGSYEASLYYHSCEEIKRLNQVSEPEKSILVKPNTK